ncbi:patatin-like phospholipase family protein [Youngiibacter fragilis]|uniref:Patatin n=1 Tax=Youngiibacter fragilis 232.1 TaxID=994573 RepID=V7I909_9CLOT|nr:patatin-like phospholipase family protein [Youngiibacter fragilis]ETA81756.1 patatin [Youngiibacter fragilis 232.1]
MYGLALGGGGARGAYEAGVLKALEELDIEVGAITGTSIGAINAAGYLSAGLSTVEEVWRLMDRNSIVDLNSESLIESLKNGGFDYEKPFSLIRSYLDEEKIRKNPIDFGIVTVNLTERDPVVLFKEDIPNGKIIDYVLASASHPVLKRFEIDGDKYMDGGLYDNLPIDPLIRKGYRDIIVVDLFAKKKIRNPISTSTIVDITPNEELGPILVPDPAHIEKNMRLGYLDTLKAFGKVFGHRYYFRNTNVSGLLSPPSATEIRRFENLSAPLLSERVFEPYMESLSHRYSITLSSLEVVSEILEISNLDIFEEPFELLQIVMDKVNEIAADIRKEHWKKRILLSELNDRQILMLSLSNPKLVVGNLFIRAINERSTDLSP